MTEKPDGPLDKIENRLNEIETKLQEIAEQLERNVVRVIQVDPKQTKESRRKK